MKDSTRKGLLWGVGLGILFLLIFSTIGLVKQKRCENDDKAVKVNLQWPLFFCVDRPNPCDYCRGSGWNCPIGCANRTIDNETLEQLRVFR